MTGRLNKRRALARIEEAQLLLQRDRAQEAAEAFGEVIDSGVLDGAELRAVHADALSAAEQHGEAEDALRAALRRFPKDVGLELRLGSTLVEHGDRAEGLALLDKVRHKLGRDSDLFVRLAAALALAGRDSDAQAAAQSAVALGAREESRLVLAIAKAKAGMLEAARGLVAPLVGSKRPEIAARAGLLHADVLLGLRRGRESLEAFTALETADRLPAKALTHMAFAAELAGEREASDALVARATQAGLDADDQLQLGFIALNRGDAPAALGLVEGAPEAGRGPWFVVEAGLVRAQALRRLGRRDEAWQVLDGLAQRPERRLEVLGARLACEAGLLSADGGDFAAATRHLEAALAVDPHVPEARRALEQAREKVAWRVELEQSAEARVEAARAETAAAKKQTTETESEIDRLKAELAKLKAERTQAERRAREAEDAARRAHAGQGERVREALADREQDADGRAKENISRALEGVACPEELFAALVVAEQTFQRALLTDLPAGSVALLFSGALERALFILYVKRFDAWLQKTGRRQEFLAGAVRERRGQRVEYFDHFVEAFDSMHAGRAPGLGEVGRVLERRAEPYLKPFRDFLLAHYALSDARYREVADFVRWSKETLRDPVAHGRFIELGYPELRTFRERLLFSFGDGDPGVLALMLEPKS